MKKILIILFFIAICSHAQKAKSKALYVTTYSIPEWYVSNEYNSFSAKINLPKNAVKVFVDGKYHSDLQSKLQFNTFFKEDLYTNQFSAINGLTRVFKEADFSDRTLKIVANILKPRANIVIKERKGPMNKKAKNTKGSFSYDLGYSYEIEFLIISNKTNETLFRHVIKRKDKYRFSLSNKKRKAFFDTKSDATNSAVKYIPKTIVITEMYKSLMKELGGKSSLKSKVQFQRHKNSFFYFYKVSKQKKHPLIKELNEIIVQFKDNTKKLHSKNRKSVKIVANKNFKNELNNIDKKHQVPFEYKLSKDYLNLTLNLEGSLNAIYDKLDIKDKIQKRLAWACMINNAHAFYSLGDFERSLQYFDKAKLIDYNQKKTVGFKSKMLKKRNKLDLFYENNELKKEVNMIYFDFLKSFRK